MLEKYFEIWHPLILEHLNYCDAWALSGCDYRRYLRFWLYTHRNCKAVIFPKYHFPSTLFELIGPERL